MNKTVLAACTVLALASAMPARAATSFGTHLGLAVLSSEGDESLTAVSWPSNALVYQPGLRIGFGDAERRNEGLFDTSLIRLDETGIGVPAKLDVFRVLEKTTLEVTPVESPAARD